MKTNDQLVDAYQAAHAAWLEAEHEAEVSGPRLSTETARKVNAARTAYLEAWDALVAAEEAALLAVEDTPSA